MPAKIRLKKVGRKGQPSYRVVVLDGRKPRDAKVVEDLGHYDPKTNPPTFEINGEAALKWLLEGAKATSAARAILSKAGVMAAWDASKRGEVVAITAKELKPDEEKKPSAKAQAKAEAAEEEVEAAAGAEVAEEAAAEEAPAEEEAGAEEAAAEEAPAEEEEAPAEETPTEEAPAEEPAVEEAAEEATVEEAPAPAEDKAADEEASDDESGEEQEKE